MAELDAKRIALLKGLFASVSDRTLALLSKALALGADDDAACFVAAHHARSERGDRDARDLVFAPIAPLGRADAGDGVDPAASLRLAFDPIPELWRLLRRTDADAVSAVAAVFADPDTRGEAAPMADTLLLIAAERLEADPDWEGLRARLEHGPAGSASRLSLALRLAPRLRAALPPATAIARAASPPAAAALRLCFSDAVAEHPGASPVLLAALAAHLPKPWQVLRLVSAVMERPSETYLAGSELASFGESVLAGIDARIARLRIFRGDTGVEGGAAAGAAVLACALELAELDSVIVLSRDGPWGRRVARQKADLADVVSKRLSEAVAVVAQALPTEPAKLRGRVRGAPRLDTPFDVLAAQRALGLLALLDGTRSSAAFGGFAAARAAAVSELDGKLDTYIDDLLAVLHAGLAGPQADAMRERLAFAADCLGFVRDPKAAQLVRRRAAAAA